MPQMESPSQSIQETRVANSKDFHLLKELLEKHYIPQLQTELCNLDGVDKKLRFVYNNKQGELRAYELLASLSDIKEQP